MPVTTQLAYSWPSLQIVYADANPGSAELRSCSRGPRECAVIISRLLRLFKEGAAVLLASAATVTQERMLIWLVQAYLARLS